MSFLNFINYFNGKKTSELNSLANASNETIRGQFEKCKTSKTNVSMFMTNFDANKDGKLDNAELAKLKKVSAFIMADDFDTKKIDTDNDGVFSDKELETFEKNQPQKTNEINKLNNATTDVINKQFKENKDNKLARFINAFDRNKDGKIDDEEAKDLKLASKYLQTDDDFDMELLDKDKNGKLDEKELGVFRLAAHFDKDNDGKLSEDEAKEFKLAVKFDEDKDGILSENELTKFNKAKQFDFDNDGMLSQNEIGKMQESNSLMPQMVQDMGQASGVSGAGCVGGNYAGSGDYSGALSALKAEPTIGQKFDMTKADITKIEKEINSVKENAVNAIKEKETAVNDMETKLLKEKESDSVVIKELKNGISDKSQKIIKNETQLRLKENEVTSLSNTISADEIVLGGLEKEFAGLKTDTPNEKVNAKNQARKSHLEQQIGDLKSKIKENKEKLEKATSERDTLKNETIPKLKEERTQLEDNLKETDASYKESVDSLQEARKTFEEAKVKIEQDRDKKVAELEKTLQAKRAEAMQLSEKNGEIKGKSGQYGAAIDTLMSKNGVLAGKGDMVAQIADEYGIPADIFAAIIAAETGRGTSKAIRYRNNPGGLMDPKTGCKSLQNFATLEQGLRKMASNLKRNYFDKGRTTLATIKPKYCPDGAANDPRGLNKNWLPTTTKFAAQINAALG